MYTDLLFCMTLHWKIGASIWKRLSRVHKVNTLFIGVEFERLASVGIQIFWVEWGTRQHPSCHCYCLLCAPCLTQNWCISLYLFFLSSLFQFLHLPSCHSPLCACLLTQNWCIPEWDNSKDSRLQVMSAASHYNWTCCDPVSATALFCICMYLYLDLNSDSYLLSTGPDAVVQFLTQLCFVYV